MILSHIHVDVSSLNGSLIACAINALSKGSRWIAGSSVNNLICLACKESSISPYFPSNESKIPFGSDALKPLDIFLLCNGEVI